MMTDIDERKELIVEVRMSQTLYDLDNDRFLENNCKKRPW